MSIFLPMHLSAWQAFLHNAFVQWCVPFVGITLGIISLVILSLIRAGRVQAKHSAEIIYIKNKGEIQYEIRNSKSTITPAILYGACRQ